MRPFGTVSAIGWKVSAMFAMSTMVGACLFEDYTSMNTSRHTCLYLNSLLPIKHIIFTQNLFYKKAPNISMAVWLWDYHLLRIDTSIGQLHVPDRIQSSQNSYQIYIKVPKGAVIRESFLFIIKMFTFI